MFCKNCGAPMEDDASFCTACGTKVTQPGQQPAADPAPAGTGAAPAGEGGQPSYAPTGASTQPSYTPTGASTQSTYAPAGGGSQPGGPVPGAPAKKKGPPTKIIAIAAAAVVVVVAIVAAVKLLGGGSGGGRNVNIDDEINFNNGGQYAYNESYCYYIGAYNDSDESTSLYRTDRSGGNKTQISTNSKVGKFRLVDDKILYRESLDEGYAIGTMGLDGSEPTTIIELEESPSKFDIRDGKLIYLVGDELRWCTLTGEEDALLQSGVETFTLYGDSLYYAKENTHKGQQAML